MKVPARAGGAVRWTGRAFLLLGAGSLFAIASIASRSAVFVFVALPLLLAPFACAALIPGSSSRADLTWAAGGLGQDVDVAGTVQGVGGSSAGDLTLELRPPPGARVRLPLRVARGKEAVKFAAGWSLAEPAIVTVPPPDVLWRDPLGLVERELDGDRPELTVERYPAELRRMDALRLDRTIPLPGETHSRRIGRSGEFYGIREAAPDEPWERINWRATARAGRPLANEFQTDLTGDVLLLLDTRPSSGEAGLDARLLGIARAGAYGIADALLRSKVRVGFASFGEFLEAVPLSTGRGHRTRLLRAIEATRLSAVAGPAERCAYSLSRYYRPGLTALVISSWAGDPAEGLVPYLRRRGFPPMLVSLSPLPMLYGSGNLSPEEETLARRLELVERRSRLAETWSFAPVVDWNDYWSLEGLGLSLRRPARRRVS